MREIHNKGIVHCDIKIDNVVLNSNEFSNAESSLITLIDFGSSVSFLDSNNPRKHRNNDKVSTFTGNLGFSSTFHMIGSGKN